MFTINYYELMFTVYCSSVYVYFRDVIAKKKTYKEKPAHFVVISLAKVLNWSLQNYRHGKKSDRFFLICRRIFLVFLHILFKNP